MFTLILLSIGVILITAGLLFAPMISRSHTNAVRAGLPVVGALVIVMSIWNTLFINVQGDQTGHYVQTYLGETMDDGQIIALNGQQGPSALTWGPGLHFVGLRGLLGDFEMLPTVEIPPGHYGELVAVDGRSLSEDAIAARPLPGTAISASDGLTRPDEPRPPASSGVNVFDAVQFLTPIEDGGLGGQQGLQATPLLPGTHRINLYLFSVRVTDNRGQLVGYWNRNGYTDDASRVPGLNNAPTVTTVVPTGFVGVVRSNINEGWRSDCSDVREVEQGDLTATLVPVGCKGVWERPLTPGEYLLNPRIYDVILIETRAQRFEYNGGFERCRIPLDVTPEGEIEQGQRTCISIPEPEGASDEAINVIVEGWNIPVELRVMVQVTADQAPGIVAAVGDLDQVEDRIITPMIRSIVRNIGGGAIYAPVPGEVFAEDTVHPFAINHDGSPVVHPAGTQRFAYRPTRALDFSENRTSIETEISASIINGSTTSGINILEVTMGDPAVPPELLIAPQRNQVASQLETTFVQEEAAQRARIATEQQRATADQQAELVSAQIYAQTQLQRGEADRDYAVAFAQGQRAAVSVMGEERAMQLRELELELNFQRDVVQMIVENPEVLSSITLPQTLLIGGNPIENAGTLFGEAMNDN